MMKTTNKARAVDVILKSEKRAGRAWCRGDLIDLVNTTSPNLSPARAKIQDRFWAIVAKYEQAQALDRLWENRERFE